MDIICEKCESQFKIPDDKIPAGKTASLTCPKCKNRIVVTGGEPEAPAEENDFAFGFDAEMEEDAGSLQYDPENEAGAAMEDKPFDFIEEEGKTALLCESDEELKKKMVSVLELMEYYVDEAADTRDALKKMRLKGYELIIANETFYSATPESNGVLMYLERLPMDIRRHIFVALISKQFRSMDHMMAFSKSVNLIINAANINDFDRILSKGIEDHEMFYRVFSESMKKFGKI